MKNFIFLTLLCISMNATSQQTLAITHVNIIDPKSKKIIKDQSLYIENWIIKQMGKTISIPPNTETINGTGKYLLPGLAEMHAHIPVPDSNGNYTVLEQTMNLFLVNGVTTLRGMLGQPFHLGIKQDLIRRSIPCPAIYTSSPSLNGNSLPDVETAERLVKKYKGDKYHFLKIHPGIKKDVYDAMARTAKSVGIDFAGHVPVEVGVRHAVASGQKTVDHLDGMIEALAPPLENLSQNGFFGFNVTDQIDLKKIKPLVADIKKSGTWVVPTQTLFTRWFSPEDPKGMINAKEMTYMPSRTRFAWVQSKSGVLSGQGYNAMRYQNFLNAHNKLLFELYKQGVPLLAGSDAPQVMNVPGFSIHHEMKSWSDAGIPNWEILKAATINVARFFNTENETGSIAVGKQANLILLNKNPVVDIKNTHSIEGVLAMGVHWMSPEKIKSILAKIAKENE